MKRVSAAVLLLLAASAVPADESKLDDRISLNLQEAMALHVLESFEQVLSLEVEVDPEITGSLSIRLDNVSVQTTLQAICESLGCEWRVEDGTLHFAAGEPPPPEDLSSRLALEPMNLDLENASAPDVFRSLARLLDAKLILDSRVDGKFSIQLEQANLNEVLSQVCDVLDCVASLHVDDEGRTLEVRAKQYD